MTIQLIAAATVDDTCYHVDDRGQSYNGTVSVTESGASCIPWGTMLPGAGTYCRNPGRTTSRPWCYTGNTTWEHCSIPVCVVLQGGCGCAFRGGCVSKNI